MRKRNIIFKESGRRVRRKKMALLFLFFLFGFGILAYRCLYLHLADDPKLTKRAQSQYQTKIAETSPRGNIYDARGEELAVSVPTYSLAMRPNKIHDRERVLGELAPILKMDLKKILSNLDSSKNFLWLKRELTPSEKDRISTLGLSGIELVKGSKRFYPNRETASQVLGAVGRENEGLGGIELFYDQYLRGAGDDSIAFRDARGQKFETEETLSHSFREGHDLTLTIRKNIQYTAEKELQDACERHRAKSCTTIIMDPRTGQILAMASYPAFNPNSYSDYDFGRWRNRAVTDAFEPGSTFKIIPAAAALQKGVVTTRDKFFCENGSYKIGKHLIHDHEKYGALSVADIIKVSSNIGIYKVGQRLGKQGLGQMIQSFGFGNKTGIDYPGEVGGVIRKYQSWEEIDFANAAFGQGVQVTPIQMATAFSAIANGGVLLRPYLVSQVTDAHGQAVLETKPKVVRRVLSQETATLVLEVMKGVTREGGTAVRASLPGYSVAGKTGTAQKVVGGKYSHTKFVSSFIGIVPAEDPRLVVLVTVDEPEGEIYGGLVAAPVFQKIAWSALVDLGIPPQKMPTPVVTPTPLVTKAGFFEGEKSLLGENSKEIPDFRGLSKRTVLALIENRGLPCDVIGSGIASDQTPPPGSLVAQGDCRIYFKTE